MNERGNQLQSRLDEHVIAGNVSPLGAVNILNTMMIDEMGYAGNVDN